jgi:hypothetical protein
VLDDGDAVGGLEGLDDAADGIEFHLFGRLVLTGGEEGEGGEQGSST